MRYAFIVFVFGFVVSICGCAVSAETAAEKQYWADKAALLDPACFQYVRGPSFDLTFDEPVYVINMMRGMIEGRPAGRQWYHRRADVDNALMVPAGFRLFNTAGDYPDVGFVYYARPSLCQTGDARYQNDPRGLYFERINRLRSMTLHVLPAYRPQGKGTVPFSGGKVLFPSDFEPGLIVHISNINAAWIAIATSDFATNRQSGRIINLDEELDDIRPQRKSSSVILPFNRSIFPAFFISHGSMNWSPGNASDPIQPVLAGTQTYPAEGALHYYKLPSDW